MNLSLDIGNTLTKAAVYQGKDMVWMQSFPTKGASDLISHLNEISFNASIIASVAEHDERLIPFLESKGRVILMSIRTPQPLRIEYESPETLGVDRLAASAGAHSLFPGDPVLVIVAGTCITYDLVTADGIYLGGAISPGISMRLKAMHTFTSRLPLVTGAKYPTLTGRNTKDSMLSGAINGTIAEVNGMAGLYRTEYPGIRVLISGGDLPFFDKCLENSIFAVQNIVLKGLNEILEFNIATDANS